jgi:hypothetical protein
MPRRWLAPDFFTDEKMKKATVPERLLGAALIANQDDDGRLRGDPNYLRAIAFLYDNYSLDEVREMRDHLTQVNPNIIVYQNASEEYIQLKQYAKYQKPRYYRPSRFPAPPGWQPPKRETPIVIPEKDLTELILERLQSGQLLLNNERIITIREQERVGNSYIDIVATDVKGNCHILELKRSALSNKHREQVCDYVNKYCDKFRLDVNSVKLTKTLIGTALSPNFSISEAQKNNVNILTIDRNMNLSQLVNATVIFTVTMTVNSTVTPRERERDRIRDKNLNLDLNRGKGKGAKHHPTPSLTSLSLSEFLKETFPQAFGRKPDSRETAQLRDLGEEISAVGGATAEQVRDAFKEACMQNKVSVRYVRAILLDWLGVGRGPPN